MREIKFRTRIPPLIRIDGSERLPGFFKYTGGEGNVEITQESIQDGLVTQYTGLKDKNGKEIYEGDIVKNPDGYVDTVSFIRREFKLEGGYLVSSSEVIGNIYENPELLK